MVRSRDFLNSEDSSVELWSAMDGQLIHQTSQTELKVEIPWQNTWTLNSELIRPVGLNEIPKWSLGKQWKENTGIKIDDEAINDLEKSLYDGTLPQVLIPISLGTENHQRGARAIDFVHPNDQTHVYTLNGVGMATLSSKGDYVVRMVSPNEFYDDWLVHQGISVDGNGGTFISPRGDLFSTHTPSVAGGYNLREMMYKLDRTQDARSLLSRVAETPEILWYSSDSNNELGIFITKRPVTFPITTLFELAEEHYIDSDVLTVYQNAVVMKKLHEQFEHVQWHLENVAQCVAPLSKPIYLKDFETLTPVTRYSKTMYKDTFGYGIAVTPHEAARLYDVSFFLKRTRPHFTETNFVMERWERRMSAFFYGYFGKEYVESWIDNTVGRLSDHTTSPGEAFSLFGSYIVDPILSELSSVHGHPIALMRSQSGSEELDRMVKKTIMKIWLALDRRESV